MGRGYNHRDDCECEWCTSTGASGSRSHSPSWIHSGLSIDFLGHRWEYSSDLTRPTKCKLCGQDVFFVRHNGGAVWFDELGPPWPKHGCYHEDENRHLEFYFGVNGKFRMPKPVSVQSLSQGMSRPRIGMVVREIRLRNGNAILEICFAGQAEYRYAVVDSEIRPEYIVGSLCASDDAPPSCLVVSYDGAAMAVTSFEESEYVWVPYSPEMSLRVRQVMVLKKLGLCWIGAVEPKEQQLRLTVYRGLFGRSFVASIAKPLFLGLKSGDIES